MTFSPKSLFAVFIAVALAACAGATAPVATGPLNSDAGSRPLVILISIDGFHPDYLGRGVTPTLSALAADGASGPMRPSFPSVTFPNHYTLVTGLHPDNHGIVSNSMMDAELGRFTMASLETRWWDQAEPIWVTVEKAGLTSATMFWPGSESVIRGERPTWFRPFDQSVSGDARVDQLLSWLDSTPRPDFATLYFDIVDSAGHRHGPDAAETDAASASADASISRLIAGLEARGLRRDTVLVIVSDHGMAATSPERVMYVDDLVPADALGFTYTGAAAFFDPVPGREAEVEAAMVKRHPHGECWRKADVPARLAYGANARVAAIVCVADVGWLFAMRAGPVARPGTHGYDNAAPEMQALFIAHGPGIARGVTLRDLDSVDVQPLLGRLLGLAVPAGDGRAADTLPAMAR